MKRLLFVDDDTSVLSGLRRGLRKFRGEWETHFAEGAQPALAMLGEHQFDLVVADMRMPGMNGAEFLDAVKEKDPTIARLVLSGDSDLDATLHSTVVAHRYLSKPCDSQVLRSVLERMFELRDSLSNPRALRLIGELGTLPSLPEHYQALRDECQREEASLEQVGKILGRDPAMAAKVLQFVNSAFFGLPREVHSIEGAVVLLGLNTISALVLSSGAFSAFDAKKMHPAAQRVFASSLRVGLLARRFAKAIELTKRASEDAFQAGLLRDIGLLALAARRRDNLECAFAHAASNNTPEHLAEAEVLGCSHATVGAYLLGLWGLSDTVVDAVSYHHHEELLGEGPRDVAYCVFLANAADELAPEGVALAERFPELAEDPCISALDDIVGEMRAEQGEAA